MLTAEQILASHKATIDDAHAFATDIASRLVGDEYAIPAFEDPAYWMVKEAELPPNVDPINPKIEDAETRARMVRTFERGLQRTAHGGRRVTGDGACTTGTG